MKDSSYDEIVRDYMIEDYEKEVSFLRDKFMNRTN